MSSHAASPRAVLFLHGAGAWGGQWAIWRRVFEADGWRVATPDLQPVAAGLAATRLGDYLAQSLGAFDALRADVPAGGGDAGPVLVGASLGGLVALALAAHLAGRERLAQGPSDGAPSALVLVNPLPPAPWAADLPSIALEGEAVRWRTQGRFGSTVRALPAVPFADRQLAFRHWRDESTAVLHEAHAGLVLPAPRMPALVLASDADADVPPGVSAAFAEGVGASLVRVPGGHVEPVMGATAAAAARAALAWLSAR